MTRNISMTAKYVISKKIVLKMMSVMESSLADRIKTVCPQRIMVKNFDENNLDAMEIGRASMKNKGYDLISYYQAPETLQGCKENEKSVVWSLGIIIDQLFTGEVFYQKLEDIISPKGKMLVT